MLSPPFVFFVDRLVPVRYLNTISSLSFAIFTW